MTPHGSRPTRPSPGWQLSLGVARDDFVAWVEESCERSGVPVRVTDPAALAQVGRLVGGRTGGPLRRVSAKGAPVRRSQSPVDVDAGWVDGPGAHRPWPDGDVVHQRPHDRGLPS